MKLLNFTLILILFICCTSAINTSVKTVSCIHLSLNLPDGTTLDSFDMGKYNSVSYRDLKLITAKDSNVYIYSVCINPLKSQYEKAGFSFYNLYYRNGLNKSVNYLLNRQIVDIVNNYAAQGDKSYEIALPVKDTLINNSRISYGTYQYEVKDSKGKIGIEEKGIMYLSQNNNIYAFYLKFSKNRLSANRNELLELLKIISSVKIK